MSRKLMLCLFLISTLGQVVAAAHTDAVVTYQITGDSAPVGEVIYNGEVVIRIRAAAGGMTVSDRTIIIASRLSNSLLNQHSQIEPAVSNGYVVVIVNGQMIATVDKTTAAMNGLHPWELASAWANNLRRCAGIEEDWWPPPVVEIPLGAGIASWYGPGFIGRYTASGELFCGTLMTAAHRSLPMGTIVRVVRIDTGDWVIVRINDRGPFASGRVIDLSWRAAEAIGLVGIGLTEVQLWLIQPL